MRRCIIRGRNYPTKTNLKYKMVSVLPIWIVKSNVSSVGPTLETLGFAFKIGSTSTFLYFDLYLNTAYAAHYVYKINLAVKIFNLILYYILALYYIYILIRIYIIKRIVL